MRCITFPSQLALLNEMRAMAGAPRAVGPFLAEPTSRETNGTVPETRDHALSGTVPLVSQLADSAENGPMARGAPAMARTSFRRAS